MLFVVILALVGFCACGKEVSLPNNLPETVAFGKVKSFISQYNYHAEQGDVNYTTLPGNNFIRLDAIERRYPVGIEYLTDINADTGLMVRILLGNDDASLNLGDDTRMNICDVLDKAIDDRNSPAAQFDVPESLALTTTRCPIFKGTKVLRPYDFPTDFTSNNIGCGPSHYRMRVETANQSLDTEAILEMRVDLTLTKNNDSCPENSSSKLLMPSILSSFAIGFIVFQLYN